MHEGHPVRVVLIETIRLGNDGQCVLEVAGGNARAGLYRGVYRTVWRGTGKRFMGHGPIMSGHNDLDACVLDGLDLLR